MKKYSSFLLALILMLSLPVSAAGGDSLSVFWLDDGMEVSISKLAAATVSAEPMKLIPVATYAGGVRRCGFINPAGEIVIEPQFDSASPFEGGFARVTVKDEDGKTKHGCINTAGEFVIEPKYDDIAAFSEGYALVMRLGEDGKTKWYGYVNTLGEEVIEPQYRYAESFADGLAKIGLSGSDYLLYGFIDKENRIVIPTRYWNIGEFSEGLVCARNLENKWGFLNTRGEVVIPFQYESARSFSEGVAAVGVAVKNGKPRCGYINISGEFLIEPRFASSYEFSNGCAMVTEFDPSETGIYFGLINASGEYIVAPVFSGIHSMVNGVSQIVIMLNTGSSLYGWYDSVSGTTIAPEYTSMSNFSDGMACIGKTNFFGTEKFGFVLPDGRVAISPKYDAATSFSNGLAVVGKKSSGNMKYGCLDTSGELVLPLEYDSVMIVRNIVVVTKDGRSGFAVNPGFGAEHTYTGPDPWALTASDTLLIVGTVAMIAAFSFVVIRDRKRKKATQV